MVITDPPNQQCVDSSTQYDVFISFKNLLPDGSPSRDSVLAREVYDYLESKGLSVFLSNVSLERLGISEYKRAIDDALDVARVLVAVGTSREHLEWRWVRYEWDSFFSDILSGVKPAGRVFVYIEGVQILKLPRSLRQAQTFIHEDGAIDALFNFISNALEHSPGSRSMKPRRDHRPLHPPRTPVARAEYDVFFVYAHADRTYVHELAKELQKRGVSYTENAAMGDPPEVAELLKEASFVVFIDSGNAKGPALYQELDVARGMGKPIVPLRVEHTPPRASSDPLRFVEAIQYLDGKGHSLSDVADQLARMTDGGIAVPTDVRRREVVDQLKAFLKELRGAFYDAQSGKSFESTEQHLRRWKSRLIRFLDANLPFDEAVSCSGIHSSLAAGHNAEHLESSFEGHKGYLEGLINEIEADPRFPLNAMATGSGKGLPSVGGFTYKES